MTAGSGRKLSALLTKSGPLGRCLKTCLVSETWASTEFLLTWKVSATKSGFLTFQLAPSVRRTVDKGFGSSAGGKTAWPTPASRDEKGQTQNPERMDYVPNIVKATWPTPRAEDSESTGAHRGTPDTLTSATRGATSSGCLAQTASFAVRLTTLSAWLMGYTAQYLAHWETASCRKSRRKS